MTPTSIVPRHTGLLSGDQPLEITWVSSQETNPQNPSSGRRDPGSHPNPNCNPFTHRSCDHNIHELCTGELFNYIDYSLGTDCHTVFYGTKRYTSIGNRARNERRDSDISNGGPHTLVYSLSPFQDRNSSIFTLTLPFCMNNSQLIVVR